MIRTFIAFIFFLLSICGKSQPNIIKLIVYSDFMNPKVVYDSLVNEVSGMDLTDSIKIIGRPIMDEVPEILIDSRLLKRFGLTEEEVRGKFDSVSKFKNIADIMKIRILDGPKNWVTFGDVASLRLKPVYYKSEIFVPFPESFEFNGRKAVKVEFYCKPMKAKKLVEFINRNMDRFSDVKTFKTEYIIGK
jgi:hypothetical protein